VAVEQKTVQIKKCKWCENEYKNSSSDFCSINCASLDLHNKLEPKIISNN